MRKALKKLLSEGVLMDMSYEGNKNSLLIKEPKNQGKGKFSRFFITGLPSETVAFSLDYTHSKVLKDRLRNSAVRNFSWLINTGHRRANLNCDIVMIVPYYGIHRVYVGELKSKLSRDVRRHCRKQLQNSKLVLDFLFSLLNEYELKESVEFEFKFVVFSNDRNAEEYNEKSQTFGTNGSKITYFEVEENGKIHYNKIIESV